jgi:hypothetical protein
MRAFLLSIAKFFIPILLLLGVMETLLRRIPNDYQKKRDFLDKHANEIEILCLGNSHGYYDLNPVYFDKPSFNAAYVSQTLDYDYRIFNKYRNRFKKLRTIIIPISYSSYYVRLEDSIESWRVKNYIINYGFVGSINFKDYFEIFSNRFITSLSRLNNYYILHNKEITCSDNGFGIISESEIKMDIEKSSIEAAKRHTVADYKFFEANSRLVEKIIGDASLNDIHVILFTPPAWSTYRMNLDTTQLIKSTEFSTRLSKKYKVVVFKSFISDSAFTRYDFFDGDHLNSSGAKKLTKKINYLIDKLD